MKQLGKELQCETCEGRPPTLNKENYGSQPYIPGLIAIFVGVCIEFVIFAALLTIEFLDRLNPVKKEKPSHSKEKELLGLKGLYENGYISEEEYEKRKNSLKE